MEEFPHEQMFDNHLLLRRPCVIDMETCPDKSEDAIIEEIVNKINSNTGKQRFYAGGWRVDSEKHLYYNGDPSCENQDALIKTTISDMFECGYAK
jgi:hypothetical protein